jgi:hypothetical protein
VSRKATQGRRIGDTDMLSKHIETRHELHAPSVLHRPSYNLPALAIVGHVGFPWTPSRGGRERNTYCATAASSMTFATAFACEIITTCDAPFTTTVSFACARSAIHACNLGGIAVS